MLNLAEIRAKYPQYRDMNDQQFADVMYRRHYADMPRAEFDKRVAAPKNISLSDVPGMALENLPQSAKQFGSDLIAPFLSPIETAKSVGNIALGGVQKLIPGEQGSEKYADAVGQFFSDRYGGWENVKRTMATDPVGFLADLSTVLSGGGSLAARAPGAIGTAGRIAQTAGRAVDPINAAATVVKPAADILGVTTGVGSTPVKTAVRAGYEGGPAADAFRESMRGNVPVESVVDDARRALSTMRQQRGAEYRAGMTGVAANTTVLDFADIEAAARNVANVGRYKGVAIDPKTYKVKQEIAEIVDAWRQLDPAEYHTPEGFDALKRAVGEIKDSAPYGSPERVVADQVYNSIRNTITKQAPDYANVMKGYEQATSIIKEIEKTLSLNPKASVDTQLRKLQSIMRNNANTNYGRREQLGKLLEQAGAPHLMEKLAGQSMAALAPRGIARAVTPAIGAGAWFNPAVLAALPAQSPRMVGEAAYYTGRGAGALRSAFDKTGLPAVELTPRGAALGAFQLGRLEDIEER